MHQLQNVPKASTAQRHRLTHTVEAFLVTGLEGFDCLVKPRRRATHKLGEGQTVETWQCRLCEHDERRHKYSGHDLFVMGCEDSSLDIRHSASQISCHLGSETGL